MPAAPNVHTSKNFKGWEFEERHQGDEDFRPLGERSKSTFRIPPTRLRPLAALWRHVPYYRRAFSSGATAAAATAAGAPGAVTRAAVPASAAPDAAATTTKTIAAAAAIAPRG